MGILSIFSLTATAIVVLLIIAKTRDATKCSCDFFYRNYVAVFAIMGHSAITVTT